MTPFILSLRFALLKKGDEFSEKLLEKFHVAVVPADSMGKGCKNIIRIAYTCSYETVEEGLKRMNQFVLENCKVN